MENGHDRSFVWREALNSCPDNFIKPQDPYACCSLVHLFIDFHLVLLWLSRKKQHAQAQKQTAVFYKMLSCFIGSIIPHDVTIH